MDDKKNERIKNLTISNDSTIYQALKLMDALDKKLLIVEREGAFLGLLSMGDIQRSILSQIDLDNPLETIIRKNIRFAAVADNKISIRNEMQEFRMEFMPVLDDKKQLADVIFWDELFEGKSHSKKKLKNQVVIMAGGKGERLKPITNVIPKPLIPIGDYPIVEQIMRSFGDYGIDRFYLTVNYKKEVIKRYFEEDASKIFNITYLNEDKPLGTAGSLSLLNGQIKETFFLTNCDILINHDYSEILDYHNENKNLLTAVSVIRDISLPYGYFITEKDGLLSSIEEKPVFKFQINAGFYILEPEALEYIPDNKHFHITDLMNALKDKKQRVGIYPINDGSWRDIGVWKQYLQNINIEHKEN